jgi:hypothetical protein
MPALPPKVSLFIAIAILLMIAWVILRIALAVTGVLLHLLWIVALIMLAMWAWAKLRGDRAP